MLLSKDDRLELSRKKVECMLHKVDGHELRLIENKECVKDAIKNVPKAGTPGFAPPEIFTGLVYQNSDLYSLGKTIIFVAFEWDYAFELLYGPVAGMNAKREDAIEKLFQKFQFLQLVELGFILRLH